MLVLWGVHMHACKKTKLLVSIYMVSTYKPIYVHIYLHWIEKQAPKIQCTLRVGAFYPNPSVFQVRRTIASPCTTFRNHASC